MTSSLQLMRRSLRLSSGHQLIERSIPLLGRTRLSYFSTAVVEEPLHEDESFLTGTSSVYAEQMYELYRADPAAVHESWRHYFDNLAAGKPYDVEAYQKPSIVPGKTSAAVAQTEAPSDSLGVAHLIRAYQVNGHTAARLDPLDVFAPEAFPYRPSNLHDLTATEGYPPELTAEYHGFSDADLDRRLHFRGTSSGGNKGYLEELAARPEKITLRMILQELQKTYCQTLAVEYMHIGDPDKQNWMRERIEHPRWLNYDKEKKQHIYERLCFADTFETFLAAKFNTTKRFGLDGGEAIVPALKDGIDRASELGVHSFVIGMPHRGRLNVLANVMRKPMPLIFAEFQGSHYTPEDHAKTDQDENWRMSGDVKCTCVGIFSFGFLR
jgi:2-oxoglutarate dehydrogenase E1 component